MQRLDDDRNFARAEKFASGEAKAQCEELRTGLTNALLQQTQKAKQKATAEKQRITEAYHTFLKETEPKLAAAKKEALAEKQKDEEVAERARIEQKEREEKEKQAAAEARAQRKEELQGEESKWQQELSQTKGLFSGKRRKEITMKLEEIAAEFRKLELIDDAEVLCTRGELKKAAISLGKESNYQYARERSLALWNDIAKRDYVSAGEYHTIGLKADGTVVAVGNNDCGQCNVSDWTDIVAISAGGSHTVGLRADGTVVAVGDNEGGKRDVGDWTNIVAVSGGDRHTVGLKSDGTVVAVGDEDGKCDVGGWTDIKLPNK